jgi:DNA-binding transcriptional ArsR family regulator
MRLQLHPVFETLCLLAGSNLGKKQKKETIKQLDDFGINGAAFYAANFPLIERYYNTFFSHMAHSNRGLIFKDMCNELVIILAVILLLRPEWQNDLSAFSDEEVRAVINDAVTSFLGSEKEIIDALEASELSDQAKWQIAALLQQPKQKLMQIAEAVNANLATFEYTYTKLEAEIVPLLTQLENQLKKGKLPPFINQALELDTTVNIMPSLAEPLIFMVFGEHCCTGLLLNRVFTGEDEALTDTEAIIVAKALGDQSKLEILRALKNRKLYSLEIAHKLGLTPATTSHHMNMLLSAGLVEVSKEGGKMYYGLRADGINRYRAWLDDNLC